MCDENKSSASAEPPPPGSPLRRPSELVGLSVSAKEAAYLLTVLAAMIGWVVNQMATRLVAVAPTVCWEVVPLDKTETKETKGWHARVEIKNMPRSPVLQNLRFEIYGTDAAEKDPNKASLVGVTGAHRSVTEPALLPPKDPEPDYSDGSAIYTMSKFDPATQLNISLTFKQKARVHVFFASPDPSPRNVAQAKDPQAVVLVKRNWETRIVEHEMGIYVWTLGILVTLLVVIILNRPIAFALVWSWQLLRRSPNGLRRLAALVRSKFPRSPSPPPDTPAS